jgi:hypothetical protein
MGLKKSFGILQRTFKQESTIEGDNFGFPELQSSSLGLIFDL